MITRNPQRDQDLINDTEPHSGLIIKRLTKIFIPTISLHNTHKITVISLFAYLCFTTTNTPATSLPNNATLARLDQGIPWQQTCAKIELSQINQLDNTAHHLQPVQISADSAQALPQTDHLQLAGNVQIAQGNQRLFAEQAIIDRRQQQVHTNGQVLLQQDNLRLFANQANYNLQHQTGQAQNIHYRLPSLPARGTATQATLVSSTKSHYRQISYTTCQPNNSAWVLRADQLDLDQTVGWGTMRHATLLFMGVPIGYTPWLSFPIDERRRSGLLAPSIGYNDNYGMEIEIPYYINLAKNYDLTLKPLWMTRRGLLLGSEWRFLTQTTKGTLQADYMARDRRYAVHQSHRGRLNFRSTSQFTDHLSGKVNLDYVSDNDYLTDLGRKLSYSSTTLLPQSAELHYQTESWNISALIKGYQVLNNGSQPYRVLPQIRLRTQELAIPDTLAYHLEAELTQFEKPGDTALEGLRFDLQSAISLPLQADYFHLTPKLGARYTQYQLRHPSNGENNAPDRLTGSFSLDGGLYFERNTIYGNQPSLQTLEPRFLYQYTTAADQDDIPIFDTTQYSFSPSSLFRTNRYTGADRVGDTNQMTFALTTRLHDRLDYQEYLQASLGQIVYFQDRTITLPGQNIATARTSSIVGDIQAKLGHHWRAGGNITWNPNSNTFDQLALKANYRVDDEHQFSLAYRLREAVTEHADLAMHWPLTDNTQLIARWQYDLTGHLTREAIAGLEYRQCCWRVRMMAHEQIDKNERSDITYMLQLELNGLGKLGSDINSLINDTLLP